MSENMSSIEEYCLMHYGMPRRSGRYPWGSGENPYQHNEDFISRVDELRAQNFEYTDDDGKHYTGDTAIAKYMGMSTTDFRLNLSIARQERQADMIARVKSLQSDGYSLNKIASIMGFNNESSVRSLLNQDAKGHTLAAQKTADFLKKQIDEKGMIDVGAGVESQLGVSRSRFDQALKILEMEGYPVYGGSVPQANPNQRTVLKVIGPPGTEHKDIYNYENINSITNDFVSHDGGDTFDPKFVYPASMDSNRLMVRYGDEGGSEKDGVIELRRGVDDLDLGKSHYAQVRILVDGTHYLKGMAIYSDDIPDGVDVVFNTNKKSGTPMLGPKDNTVLKPIKNDPNDPFGSLIKDGVIDPDKPQSTEGGQSYYYDKNGNKKLSLINKRAEEGDWGEWADRLSAQFLSKQKNELIKRQLGLAIADKNEEFDEINSLTNPTVKRTLLNTFAEDCDSAAVHLYAAALPRQKYQVILPLKSIKDNEVYAPNYEEGETVALIRYPHAGTFEIPILKVNNKQPEGERVIGHDSKDAIGINSKVAAQLSGADFDGDTVMVIPCNSSKSKVNITATRPLSDLANFDAKLEYGGKAEGTFKPMKNTQTEMGLISNLITDMTLKGADEKELARAVRHSMVVIDAEKHGLDYKQSEIDNGIKALRKKYQERIDENGNIKTGAATLISRSKSPVNVLKRKGSPRVDPQTGELIFKEVKEEYTDKHGKKRVRTQESTQMAETKDARTLSSGTPQEELYADYANKMKSLANKARLAAINTGRSKYSASARDTYKSEVSSLAAKLRISKTNAPKERMANLAATSQISAMIKAHPDMTKKEIKKARQKALTAARVRFGAQRTPVDISDREWEAIQSGAVHDSMMSEILRFADKDAIRQRATPRTKTTLSQAKQDKIKAMSVSGYTNKEIADALGISSTTVTKYTRG